MERSQNTGRQAGSIPRGTQRDQDAEQRDHAADRRDDHGTQRDQRGNQRDQDAVQRDQLGDERDQVADERDHDADERDHDAEQRDHDATARDHDAERRDEDAERRDRAEARVGGSTLDHERSAARRREAAADRDRASRDRDASAAQRTFAELDRGQALADRAAGTTSRDQSESDRGTALADRAAGARGRLSAEIDRDTAMGDRTAAADDRQYASQLVTSLEFGWTMRQVDPPELLYASPGCLKILGMDPDGPAPTLREAECMIYPGDHDRVLADYLSPEASSRSVQVEMRIVRADGEVRWIRCTSNPVKDSGVGVNRAAATVEDITSRKTAEAATRSAHWEAERANAAKSEFLSRMSHELRTPLNAVLGFAQLLELDPLSEYQESAVRHILGGGRHLLEMINDILDISRIETDQLVLAVSSVRVADLISDTVGLMEPFAADHQVTIRTAGPAADRFVLGDLRRLRQVMLNLLSNAIKYNVAGGSVALACHLGADGKVKISVSDTGRGIRKEDQHRLFTPFDRIDVNPIEIEGMGIGLALSHRLLSLMGGALEVQSEPGTGSTFTISMPLALPTRSTPRNLAPEPRAGRSIEVRPSVLLYIEDNLSNVELIRRILERRPGWELVHAATGGRGLELAAESSASLILLDLHLPDMSGQEVLEVLRAQPASYNTPLVVVSADVNQAQIDDLLAAGATAYLTKPLNVVDVLGLLSRYAEVAVNQGT